MNARLVVGIVVVASALSAPAAAQRAPLVGVASARRASGGIAAWSQHELFVGDAEGAAFRRVALAGVLDVVIDDDGTMLVTRTIDPAHAVIELVHPNGTIERVRDEYARALAAGAGVLAFVDDEGVVWRSDDHGRSWASVAVPAACEGCGANVVAYGVDLAVGSDGSLVLVDVEINTCGSSDRLEWQRWMRAPRGRAFAASPIVLSRHDYAATWRLGAFGWAYGESYAERLIAASGTETHVVGPSSMHGAPMLADNGRATVVVADAGLLQIERERARVLDPAPPVIEALAVDPRARPLAIVGGTLRRFRRRGGWETVLAP